MAGLAGVVADAAQAVVEDDAAMASAMALAAAMSAAQMAADAVAMALSQTMGTDPGIPPSVGALLMGHPTVLIGGFPLIDIPNQINMILDKLSQLKAKSRRKTGLRRGRRTRRRRDRANGRQCRLPNPRPHPALLASLL
jgi:hypothetical protein